MAILGANLQRLLDKYSIKRTGGWWIGRQWHPIKLKLVAGSNPNFVAGEYEYFR